MPLKFDPCNCGPSLLSLIQPRTHPPYYTNPNHKQPFSVRVPEADVEQLPELLIAIPPARIRQMQRAMAAVWHRFAWLSHPALHRIAREVMEENAKAAAEKLLWGDPLGQQTRPWLKALRPGEWRDDAFHTIVQWLHHKLEQRRGQQLKVGEPGAAGTATAVQQQQQQQGSGDGSGSSSSSSSPAVLLEQQQHWRERKERPHRRPGHAWEATEDEEGGPASVN